MDRTSAQALFIKATQDMHGEGRTLMQRVIDNQSAETTSWLHYPQSDVVNGPLGARWFYHSHPPEERAPDEHGHFHLFIARSAMAPGIAPIMAPPPVEAPRAEVVHVAALSIDYRGLPTGWFATNRWVTDEAVYPAPAIINLLNHVDFRGTQGDPLVNDWLTAILAIDAERIATMLRERDYAIAAEGIHAEDRAREVIASLRLSLDDLLN